MKQPHINAFMNGYFPDRMEPEGPTRYLKTDSDIRSYLNKDRKLVSSILVQSAMRVLQSTFNFSEEQLALFHAELQKEICDQ